MAFCVASSCFCESRTSCSSSAVLRTFFSASSANTVIASFIVSSRAPRDSTSISNKLPGSSSMSDDI
uniref:Uncharacterized protein n=2 Tax=Nyssomyia neivai TaxID=330878 RepID=A0A1L8D7Z4_9DIPT